MTCFLEGEGRKLMVLVLGRGLGLVFFVSFFCGRGRGGKEEEGVE